MYTLDSRDSPSNPSYGSYFQSTTEIAVPTGMLSACYLRTDLQIQKHVAIPLSFTSNYYLLKNQINHYTQLLGSKSSINSFRYSNKKNDDDDNINEENFKFVDKSKCMIASITGSVGVLWPLCTSISLLLAATRKTNTATVIQQPNDDIKDQISNIKRIGNWQLSDKRKVDIDDHSTFRVYLSDK